MPNAKRPPDAKLGRLWELLRRLEEEIEAGDLDLGDLLDVATSFEEVVTGIVHSALEDETVVSGLEERMGDLEEELNRIEDRAEAKRKLALLVMLEAGLEHLEASGLTIDVRKTSRSLLVVDEDVLPDDFKIPQPAWIDYQKIQAAMRNGITVPGAVLEDSETSLVVRQVA